MWKTKLLLVAASLMLSASPSFATEPELWGDHVVGFEYYHSIDTNRNDLVIPSFLWYPVDQAEAAGRAPLRYPYQHDWDADPLLWHLSPFIGGVTDAAISSDGLFPIVALSHGNCSASGTCGWAQSFIKLGESLASHGYVVAAVAHPGHTGFTPPEDRISDAEARVSRPQDLRAVIDSLIQRGATEGDNLHGGINADRIGLGGYSRGANTIVTAAAGSVSNGIPPDPRIDGLLFVDSAVTRDEARTLTIPALSIGQVGVVAKSSFNLSAAERIYGYELDATHHYSWGTLWCQFREEVLAENPPANVADFINSDHISCVSPTLRTLDEVQEESAKQAVAYFSKQLLEDDQYRSRLEPALDGTESERDVSFSVSVSDAFTLVKALLTDPAGRRLGTDLESFQVFNEIPGAAIHRTVGELFRLVLPEAEVMEGVYSVESWVGENRLGFPVESFSVGYARAGHATKDGKRTTVREPLALIQTPPNTFLPPLEFTFDNIFTAVLEGDYNNDGTVNAADYVVWRDNLGAPAGTLPNDVHGGTIGPAQYDTWKANFGATRVAGSGDANPSSVPEPATWMMMWAVLVVAGQRRLPCNRPAIPQLEGFNIYRCRRLFFPKWCW